ncbi:FAD-dependent oxidoreductase [Facklamia miroungae]|uniref:FAD-dependent oxidoreductase n=1 Tax=Facklamia miroungae TaxID=120956 RepID=UPI000B7F91F4|nr:FAD-dependent oxidoreductase [Facklamia miroungae]
MSKELSELHFANNASYREQGINIHPASQVVGLNPDQKTVTVKTEEGEYQESYDKLLLSPGGFAPVPPFEGVNLENVHTFRGPEDTQAVYDRMKETENLVVIGSGYIGIEVATAYAEAGINVTVIDMEDRILPAYLDKDISSLLEAHGAEKGLHFKGGEAVQKLLGEGNKVKAVVTDKGEYPADTVVVAVGVKPATDWLKGTLEINEAGFIQTNEYLETSAKDVYAGGDATYVPFAPTDDKTNIGLATLARRQGIVAALNASGTKFKMPRVSGTSALRYFDYTIASTGLSLNNADLYEGEVAWKYVEEKVYPDFMRKPGTVHMTIFYDEESHVILGGQLVSKFDVADSINVLSTAINAKYTLEQLALLDFFFQPNYDRPWHYLNVLAIEALGNTVGGADKLLF